MINVFIQQQIKKRVYVKKILAFSFCVFGCVSFVNATNVQEVRADSCCDRSLGMVLNSTRVQIVSAEELMRRVHAFDREIGEDEWHYWETSRIIENLAGRNVELAVVAEVVFNGICLIQATLGTQRDPTLQSFGEHVICMLLFVDPYPCVLTSYTVDLFDEIYRRNSLGEGDR